MQRTEEEDKGPPILSDDESEELSDIESDDDKSSDNSDDEFCSGNIGWLPRDKQPPLYVSDETPIYENEYQNGLMWKRNVEIQDNPGVIY